MVVLILAQGNVHYFTTNGSGATTAAIKYKGGNNLSSFMKVGDNISVSLISKPNNSEYINAVTIDGGAVTEEWSGGTPSSASGGASTVTITTINITRYCLILVHQIVIIWYYVLLLTMNRRGLINE